MIGTRLCAAGAAFLLLCAAQASPPQNVSQLAWMSGDWVTEEDGRWTEEHWSRPRGGVMLGASLSGSGDRAGNYEFLRIAADSDGVLTYWGSPQGKTPVGFRVVTISASEAIFENPEHDFPTRIAYRRTGATLTATISGPGGAKAQSWTYHRSTPLPPAGGTSGGPK